MTKNCDLFFRKLNSHLNYLEKTRLKTEQLFSNGDIVRRDIELVYGGLFLDVHASFEIFLENLFINLLMGKYSHLSKNIIPKVKIKSYSVARKIVFEGQRYASWLPYDNTLKRAKMYFKLAEPFNCLNNNDNSDLRKLQIIRNAIAHNSNYSLRLFKNKVIGTRLLTSDEKNPLGYLRSIYRTAPPLIRYEYYKNSILSISYKITH